MNNKLKIIPENEPPLNIKPTLMGSLLKSRVEVSDIIAGFIYLAELGYLEIKEIKRNDKNNKRDYVFKLLKNDISNLDRIEKSIINYYFNNNLVIGKEIKFFDFVFNLFRKNSFPFPFNTDITKEIYKEMVDKNFYKVSPDKQKNPYLIISIILVLISLTLSFINLLLSIVLVSFGIIIVIIGLNSIKKTDLGEKTINHIRGFKLFLSEDNGHKIKSMDETEKEKIFMKYLPYAISFKVEKKWIKQFEGVKKSKPIWYQSNFSESFDIGNLINGLSSIPGEPWRNYDLVN